MTQNELASIWRNIRIEPDVELRKWPISVSMASSNFGGMQDGWTLGVSGSELRLCDPSTTYRISGIPQLGVSVYAVPMVEGDKSITSGDICTLPSESAICITPLLSGCTVGIKRDGSSMFHKRPDNKANQDGVALQREITKTYGDDFRLIGGINYVNASYCTVIGINVFGWEFWMQKLNRGSSGLEVIGLSKIGLS